MATTAYAFQPSASDADDDPLTFSISNKPAWASFNTGSGRLSGTPADSHVGTTSGIVISVSDGTDSVSLPAFSLEVTAVPNTAPLISGNPAGTVMATTAYAFQPSACDADGDPLTFSISNKPAWASFNTASGLLERHARRRPRRHHRQHRDFRQRRHRQRQPAGLQSRGHGRPE